MKKKVLFVFLLGILIILISMIFNIEASKKLPKGDSEKIYKEPLNNNDDNELTKPIIVSTDENGYQEVINKENELAKIESFIENVSNLEQNINYRTYKGNEADVYYTTEYKKKISLEKKKYVSLIKQNEIEKFIHSFMVMSVNYLNNGKIIVSCFFGDCLQKCEDEAFKINNGYDVDGCAERLIEYILVLENGEYKIEDERSI